MLSGSMPLLAYPAACGGTSYRTNSYIPGTPPTAFCSSDVNPAFGFCLPSNYQGNHWLLDNCQDTYGNMCSSKSPSCETKACTTSWNPLNYYVPCNSPSVDKVYATYESTHIGARPSLSPRTHTNGYVSHCCTPKTCQSLSNGSQKLGKLNCSSKSFQPLHHCRLDSLEYGSYHNLGFLPSGFSPPCYVASSCPTQHYLVRNCQYLDYRPINCQPLGYFSRNIQSLSYMPSTFPPLRYLCSGCRPLNCY